jgi:predicted ATPase
MLKTLAISNYRSLRELIVPLDRLNLITGPNGSGKSNVYRALRLLAETAQGGVVNALAREGGLASSFWAGPETISRRMRAGEVPVQGTRASGPKRLQLGFAGDDFGYAISLGLPVKSNSAFTLDPEIKHECIWAARETRPAFRPASALVMREASMIKMRRDREWHVSEIRVNTFDSLFNHVADPAATPEVFTVRESIRSWRFYDHFRADGEAPARLPQLGTRTPVMHHDGHDLAAALQTRRETRRRWMPQLPMPFQARMWRSICRPMAGSPCSSFRKVCYVRFAVQNFQMARCAICCGWPRCSHRGRPR